jgi:thioesterase domain-containing protein
MSIPELLLDLRQRDIRLSIDGDRLKCDAPAGALTAELREVVANRKAEIVAFLRQAQSIVEGPRALVPLKPEGRRPPLFAVPGHNGDVFCYVALARHMDPDQPLYGVQPPGVDGSEPLRSVERLAAYEVEQIRRLRPEGPYLLAGYCAGGTVAFEVARQLSEQGQRVALLALLASPFPTAYRRTAQLRPVAVELVGRVTRHLRALAALSPAGALGYLSARSRKWRAKRGADTRALADPVVANRHRVGQATMAAVRSYRPMRFPGRIDLFLPSEAWRESGDRPEKWSTVADSVREHVGPDGYDGDAILLEPQVPAIAALLRRRLDEVAGAGW